MKNNIIDYKELEKARKKAARREWFEEKKQRAITFVEEHKEVIVVLAPVVIGGCAKLVQLGLKTYNIEKQEELKIFMFTTEVLVITGNFVENLTTLNGLKSNKEGKMEKGWVIFLTN